MGAGFSLTEWSETWLKTSGVNILEPILERNDDWTIKTICIKQTCDLRGKNSLRKQKLNVLVFDEDQVPHVIKDVVISDKEALTSLSLEGVPTRAEAVFINYDEHAYCKIRFDKGALDFCERHLFKIDNILTRAAIWRHLWTLVEDCKLNPLQYYMFVMANLSQETIVESISTTIVKLTTLFGCYFPLEMVSLSKKQAFNTLLSILENCLDSLKSTIVDNIFYFVDDVEHIELIQKWLEQGNIQIGDTKFDLKSGHKSQIVARLFKT